VSTNEKLGMQQILKAGPTLQIWAVDHVSEAKVTHPILVLAMELLDQFLNGLCIFLWWTFSGFARVTTHKRLT
jgi:hypothetical protein